MSEFKLIIDGQKVSSDKTFDVINPADESIVAACPQGTVEHLDAAVNAANKAFPAWAALSMENRTAKLHELASLIEQNHAELAELLVKEQGKTLSGLGANMEVAGAVAWTQVTAGLELPVEIIQDNDESRIELYRKPVGVVGSITPWNWPLSIAIWHIMPALKVGCTVVIKPSPFTPLSTLKLVEILNEALPAGVLNAVTGDTEVGNRMTSHPDIDKIVFTGSIKTGKHIMANAADTLKKLTLELGGNDAGIILPGTSIDDKLEGLFWGAFINAGQTCAALKRLYVHEDQYEEVCNKLADFMSNIPVGNGMDESNLIGPLNNKMQYQIVSDLVEDARENGARIICGGNPKDEPGFFYPLTLIADATDDFRIVKEEQFGTALPVIKYKTIEEAIEKANALDVGLGGSIWGDNKAEAVKYAQQLECGTAWINQHGMVNPMAPFGGVKCSGIGVEFNIDGLKEYTTIQVLNIAS